IKPKLIKLCLRQLRDMPNITNKPMSLPVFITRHAIRIGLSLAILAFLLSSTIGKLDIGFIKGLENYAYDARLNLMLPGTQDSRIVIVDIDERSLQEQGRWPWSRNRLAALVDRLFDQYQINTLGFDVGFAEKDESSGLKNLELIGESLGPDNGFRAIVEKFRRRLDYDRILAASFKNRNVVLGYYFHQDANSKVSVGALPSPSFTADSVDGRAIGIRQASGYGANLPVLQQNAVGAGHFNPAPDADG